MTQLFVIVVIWGFITLVGHASWLLIAGLLRRVTGAAHKPRRQTTERQAFDRVLEQLHGRGLIERSEAETLWDKASRLSHPHPTQRPDVTGLVKPIPAVASRVIQADRLTVAHVDLPMVGPNDELLVVATVDSASPRVLEPVALSDPFAEPGPERLAPKSQRSWGSVIESFLAVHNIRWGELIAGLLIVVCSVGLVISLWSTLVNAHRIVPTIVFLLANAAIFAAGFYTLAKWRLRHTSRAVLLIATLLVPLSVLAGLATASQSQASVSLDDPITLFAILVSTIVNVVLLLRAGRALYGREKGRAFALAVATPAALIPFIPAALRIAGESASLLVVPASLAVALSIVWFQRPWPRRRLPGHYLAAVSRHQWTFLAVSMFSLSALAIAISLLGRQNDQDLWLGLVSGCVPSMIAVAVAAHWTSRRTKLQTHQFIGRAVAVLGNAALLAMLMLFTQDAGWLWWYGGIASTSYLVAWALYRPAPWLAMAIVPLGLATILSSTAVLQQIDWNAVSWQRRLVGGEPMLANLLLAAISGLALVGLRQSANRHSFLLLSGAWLSLASINATLLAFATDSWRGVVPEWALVGVLVVLVVSYAAASILTRVPASISIALACITTYTVFSPFNLLNGGESEAAATWLNAFTCAAFVLTLLSLTADRLLSPRLLGVLNIADASVHASLVARSTSQWLQGTAVLSLLSLVAALMAIADHELATQKVSTILVAACFLVVAVAWFVLSRRTDAFQRSMLAAMIVAPALTVWVPAFFDVHLVTWIQITALVALVWAELARAIQRHARADQPADHSGKRDSLTHLVAVAVAVGLCTAIAASIDPIFGIARFEEYLTPIGFSISVAAVVYATVFPVWIVAGRREGRLARLPWPIGISLLAGQLTWLAAQWLPQLAANSLLIVFSWFILAAIGSLFRMGHSKQSVDHWHLLVLSILALFVAQWSVTLPVGFVLILLAIVGIASTLRRHEFGSTIWAQRPGSLTLLYVFLAQAWTLMQSAQTRQDLGWTWTFLVVCNAAWIVVGSLLPALTQRTTDVGGRSRGPMPELSFLIASMVIFEIISHFVGGFQPIELARFGARFVLLQLCITAIWVRASTWTQVSMPISLCVALVGLLVIRLSLFADLDHADVLTFASLTMAMVSALLAFYFPFMARVHRYSRSKAAMPNALTMGSYALAVLGPLTMTAVASAIAAMSLMLHHDAASIVHLTIAGVAISALGVCELSERLRRDSLQHYTLGLGLLAIYLWASAPFSEQPYPILSGTMRWLVASVWMIPALLWGIPRTLGQAWADRWRESLRMAASAAAAVGTGSLVAMLLQEVSMRSTNGIQGLSLALVIGVALTIGALSVISAVVALASGPSLSGSAGVMEISKWQLDNQHRRALIIAAQLLGAVTLLHIMLCKPEFGLGRLREYWPYLVLGLSFLSVGLVEWTRARGDQVIADTLKQTSLYLPLIPIGGLLLSGTWSTPLLGVISGIPTVFLVLVIASGYYVMLSRLWPNWISRVLMFLFANSAVWSLLAAQPGWSVLHHPQLWLIPPAVCVLWVAHHYRHQMDAKLVTGLSYGATLVIYITSTADMLIQQIGTSLWGPIVLILLALAGVAAGALLRIRPFLYLGTVFVFIGVTSMVWHAQRSIDQVWPWWAFGITTGVGLLAGLMSIEKNKGMLKAMSARLAAWDS